LPAIISQARNKNLITQISWTCSRSRHQRNYVIVTSCFIFSI
jgi:hypothetical protein